MLNPPADRTVPRALAPVPAEPAETPAAPVIGFTQEQIDALATRFPRMGSLHNFRGKLPYQIALRAPKRSEYKRFRAMVNEPARRSEAQEHLVRAVVVAVWWKGVAHLTEGAARTALDDLLEEYPAACDSTAASEVVEKLVSGAVAEEEKD